MPFVQFKDLDKPASDIINDDYDLKHSIKIKATAPFDATITTNTTYEPSKVDYKLATKLSIKKEIKAAGFTVEKLEMGVDGRLAVETSLKDTFKGLKLEFKGDDRSKGDLSFSYTHPRVTATGEIDAVGVKKAKGSLTTGFDSLLVGGSADFDLAATKIDKLSVGIAYKTPLLYAVLRSDKTFADITGLVSYNALAKLTLAGRGTYDRKSSATSFSLGALYKCNERAVVKAKASSAGLINASYKQTFEKKLTIVNALEVPYQLNSWKWGVAATLG